MGAITARMGWGRIADVSEYCHVSERTVRNWLRRGLPFSKVCGVVVISFRSVDEFLEKHQKADDSGKFFDELLEGF